MSLEFLGPNRITSSEFTLSIRACRTEKIMFSSISCRFASPDMINVSVENIAAATDHVCLTRDVVAAARREGPI